MATAIAALSAATKLTHLVRLPPTSKLAAIEVYRTSCIVTHPPAGELMNDALVNPANEKLVGTRFSPTECWYYLHGGGQPEDLPCTPRECIDGIVTELGGAELRASLDAQPADAAGNRCPVGGAVVTPAFSQLRDMYKSLIHVVPPRYKRFHILEQDQAAAGAQQEGVWARQLAATYRSAFDVAVTNGLTGIAVPLLGAGTKGAPTDAAIRVAAEFAVAYGAPLGRDDGSSGSASGLDAKCKSLTVRFAVQDETKAEALSSAIDAAITTRS
jgi:O-acetyl-ADP-ribose deacetylase (regulator of RNase III)